MKTNVGSVDRIIRLLVSALIVALYFMNIISGTWAIVLLVLAAVFTLTAIVGTCPIYMALGMSTGKKL